MHMYCLFYNQSWRELALKRNFRTLFSVNQQKKNMLVSDVRIIQLLPRMLLERAEWLG